MLTQTLQGMRVVKAYGQESERSAPLPARSSENVRRYLVKTQRSRARVGPVSEAMTGLGLAAAMLYGGWQGIYGNVSLGHFMGFLTAAMLAFQPMRAAGHGAGDAERGTARGGAHLRADRPYLACDREARRQAAARHARARSASAASISPMTTAARVLSDFSLEIAAGQKVALVGPSGAGKSTVLNLILRFFDPVRGAILIDGQDLRDATLASVRGASALLTQDPVLFDDTVAANIAYGSEGATDEAIVAAAEAAAAHDFIMRLPDGYATRVGEARQPSLRRRAPAHRLRARHAARHADPAARRADQRARRGIGSEGAGGYGQAPRRPHRGDDRPPAVDRAARPT